MLAVTPIRSATGDGTVLGVGLALFIVFAAMQPGLIPILAVSAARNASDDDINVCIDTMIQLPTQ
ncbi:hypothetical protein [Microbacterium sp. C448]|uniref:hypothetical protein n=1 Tax=Microbacterium sp. C448 TaxID=1177594 RepID=UPI001182CB4C|nr:hypothetical protein [Microbacterium sp. C448]